MRTMIRIHWLSGILLLAFSFSLVAPAISHDDDDHDEDKTAQQTTTAAKTQEGERTENHERQSAGAKSFAMAFDTLMNGMNESFYMIEPMIKKSCYDCHSDQTNFPWYHSLPLVGGWMDEHIEHAREHLDFSDGFPLKGRGSQLKLFAEIIEEVEEKEMPLTSYRIMHWGTAIEGAQLDTLKRWFNAYSGLLKTTYGFYGEPLPEDIF